MPPPCITASLDLTIILSLLSSSRLLKNYSTPPSSFIGRLPVLLSTILSYKSPPQVLHGCRKVVPASYGIISWIARTMSRNHPLDEIKDEERGLRLNSVKGHLSITRLSGPGCPSCSSLIPPIFTMASLLLYHYSGRGLICSRVPSLV